MLRRLAWIAAQYPEDARRFVELGAPAEIVDVVGNVEFDVELPDDFAERVATLRSRWETADRQVWVAAGTHPGEDPTVLDAHRRLLEQEPRALLILVPRHPERFDAIVELAGDGLVAQRMTTATGSRAQVIVGDTMGQLIYLYGVAQVAFMGGSLVGHGGDNPIEAAATGLPLVMGPHELNFSSIVAAFDVAGCLHRVTDSASLARAVGGLFADSSRRAVEVNRARDVVAANAGATEKIARRLAVLIDDQPITGR